MTTIRRMTNRKMKITWMRNTYEGVEHVICRASGMHNGHYIERTAKQPAYLSGPDSETILEQLVRGDYERETRILDGKEPPRGMK